MEREESQAKEHQSWRFGTTAKPSHGSFGNIGTQVDRTFRADGKTRPRSFPLVDSEGRVLEHSWNTDNLRHFYI
jgi:hypothetical protein